MASLNQILDAINANNATLNTIANEVVTETTATNAVKASVDNVTAAVNAVKGSVDAAAAEIGNLVTLQSFADQALSQLSQQSQTIICILENISKNTCALLNEAHTQTGLQKAMAASFENLAEMFRTANPAAALELHRMRELRAKIEECCPPPAPAPPCNYHPCPAPPPLGPPPVGPPSVKTN